jgi:hypothetical protein
MMVENTILLKDPYLLDGEQYSFIYGVTGYLISAVFYPFFTYLTIDALMFLLSIINLVLLSKLIKKNNLTFIIVLFSILTFPLQDSYIIYLSLTLFWVALVMYKNKRNWKIPLFIACFNHPVTLIPSLYFLFKDKRGWLIISAPIIVYYVISSFLFSSSLVFHISYFVNIILRAIIFLSPILVEKNINFIKKVFKHPSQFIMKSTLVVITLLIIFNETNFNLLTLPHKELLTNDVSEGFQLINGSIRVVDYAFLPAVYHFPKNNIILGVGAYRENNPINNYHQLYRTLNDYKEGVEVYDYVLHCKYCNPPVNDKLYLDEYFNKVGENDYYFLYNLSSLN